LEEIGVIIQLADRSNLYPKGVVEDVLVQVNQLIFPVDFYVIKMKDDEIATAGTLLLGRPFLQTTRTKIGVYEGLLSMEIDGEVVTFNLYKAIRYPTELDSIHFVDVIGNMAREDEELEKEDTLDMVLSNSITKRSYAVIEY